MKALGSALLLTTLFTSLSSFAGTIEVAVNQKSTLEYKVVTTQEACALTIDPSWSHEEDTTYAKSILDYKSFMTTEALIAQGYKYYGLRNGKKCAEDASNTFTYLRNPKPMNGFSDLYFYYATTGKRLAEVAAAQGAFVTVERIYIKGVEEFKDSVKDALYNEVDNAVDSLK